MPSSGIDHHGEWDARPGSEAAAAEAGGHVDPGYGAAARSIQQVEAAAAAIRGQDRGTGIHAAQESSRPHIDEGNPQPNAPGERHEAAPGDWIEREHRSWGAGERHYDGGGTAGQGAYEGRTAQPGKQG